MNHSRRSFVGALLAGVAGLASIGFSTARRRDFPVEFERQPVVEPQPYKVHTSPHGFDFVHVPWSDPTHPDGQSVQPRVLTPAGETLGSVYGYSGHFIETDTGMREIAKDARAKLIVLCAMHQYPMHNRIARYANVLRTLRLA